MVDIDDASRSALVVFSEPDRTSLTGNRQTFRRDFGIDVAFSGVPARVVRGVGVAIG